ncbi:MAG: peptidyl-prolyl cis-trans isomerase D, partial [bacterium]
MEVFFLKMLRLLNNSKRSQKAIWIMASILVVAGMVVFYAPMGNAPLISADGKALPVSDKDLVAKVDKQEITAQDYMSGLNSMMQMYKQFMNQGGKEMDLNQVKSMGLDKNLLQSLIRKKIVELEVKRLNLEASDEEVKVRIREQFTVEGKWIGYDKYQR